VNCFPETRSTEMLPRQRLRALVVWEKVEQFVAKDCDAAGFEANHRDSRFDFRRQRVEDFEQQLLRAVEHAKIVERATAAKICARKNYVISSGFENIDRGFGGRGQEIVVEGVGHRRRCGRQGLKPGFLLALDAALKRRSSTARLKPCSDTSRTTLASLRGRTNASAPTRVCVSRTVEPLPEVSGAKAGMLRWCGIPATIFATSRKTAVVSSD